jgi:hypothetical protein
MGKKEEGDLKGVILPYERMGGSLLLEDVLLFLLCLLLFQHHQINQQIIGFK